MLQCGGPARQESLRLLNALASDGAGRRYLLAPGSRVVSALSAAVIHGRAVQVDSFKTHVESA
jgi:hypothetical protein